MEPWCGDIMGKHISSVEQCIGSKEHYMHSCVYLTVGGFGFGSVDFLCTLPFSVHIDILKPFGCVHQQVCH